MTMPIETDTLPLPLGRGAKAPKRRLPLVQQLLREQKDLSAVERFARRHEAGEVAPSARVYRDLLPAAPPGPGEQYAFAVDLDACTACKACVTACHNLNGLDEGETWRAVGMLHGGTTAAPVRQAVTTACHHCVEPACMSGCPVAAYEKDAATGIVRHLDDQCIGCQYCTFTCPYDVPQYNAARGIVRKCDMCSGRLASGDAPACVQACPTGAIAITVVKQSQAVEDAQGDAFLPGAPSPGLTIPTTSYTTARALPRNVLPVNFYAASPAAEHRPLVLMLVFTQLSVGTFVVSDLAGRIFGSWAAELPLHAALTALAGIAALGASLFHLGRPLFAFRAVLGLRTSWMSREIVAFGLFAPLAVLYTAALGHGLVASVLGVAPLSEAAAAAAQGALAIAVQVTGLAGILCSALIYHATRRPVWSGVATTFRFFTTAAILGLAATVVPLALKGPSGAAAVRALSLALALVSATKLLAEAAFFRHLVARHHTDLKRSAQLMRRDLLGYTASRFALLAIGGVLVPAWHAGRSPSAGIAACGLALAVVAELLERTLFFAAAASRGMPGGLR